MNPSHFSQNQEQDKNIEHEFKYEIPKIVFEALVQNQLEDIELNQQQRLIFERDKTKVRPYLYFDTKDTRLLKAGRQLSLRRREKDFSVTYKTPIQNPKDAYIVNRTENNLNITLEKGEEIVRELHLGPIEDSSPIQDALKFSGMKQGADFHPLCVYTVETQRNHGRISIGGHELLEIAFDKIQIKNAETIYEMEMELKSLSDTKIINVEVIQKLNSIALNMLNHVLKKKNIDFNFLEHRLNKAKFQRVLEKLGKL